MADNQGLGGPDNNVSSINFFCHLHFSGDTRYRQCYVQSSSIEDRNQHMTTSRTIVSDLYQDQWPLQSLHPVCSQNPTQRLLIGCMT